MTTGSWESIKQDKAKLTDWFKFCVSDFMAENILFLLAVDAYKRGPQKAKLELIWKMFLAGSVKEGIGYSTTNQEDCTVNLPSEVAGNIQTQIKVGKYISHRSVGRRIQAGAFGQLFTSPGVPPAQIFDSAAKEINHSLLDPWIQRYAFGEGDSAYKAMSKGSKATEDKKIKKALDALAKVGIHLRDQLGWQ